MPKGRKGGKAAKARREAKTRSLVTGEAVDDYRHDEKRKNIPSSGQADYDTTPIEKKRYEYDPHLDPQLVWAGKAERLSFDVDTVSLHIHERISTQAILRAVQSKAVQRTLFNDPAEELRPGQRIEFYKHDMGWTNRLILGDSLVVMNSLLEREGIAGKVQMVYIDPPYGVNFNSNFQPALGSREVKHGDDRSLTREPEQIRAYRDTWTLGVHSYLAYLRDRLLLARSLLSESGSVFVQIGEENVHRVRCILDEIFGAPNAMPLISFAKTSGATADFLPQTNDFLLWYAKDRTQVKFRPLYHRKEFGGAGATAYTRVQLPDGTRRPMTAEERDDPARLPKGSRIYRLDNLTSQSIGREKGEGAASWFSVEFAGKKFNPGPRSRWKTNEAGMDALRRANRLDSTGTGLYYVRYLDDFPAFPITGTWTDTVIAGFASDKQYVVETSTKVVERCLLLTTDPGDLVVDPTCGSGTTALVAEQWGRRWITIDTSRVAVALARQRIITARFAYYVLQNADLGLRGNFQYEALARTTLRSIAQGVHEESVALYDSPLRDETRVRVAGPFTTEAIPKFTLTAGQTGNGQAANIQAHIANMIELLRKDGVTFKGGKKLAFTRLSPASSGVIHGEGEAEQDGKPVRLAVSFGPMHGPVTADQVIEGIRDVPSDAKVLIFVGFSFDPEVYAFRDKKAPKSVRVEFAHAAADILVGDLLKTKRTDQLFTVFGEVDVGLKPSGGKFQVEVRGLDVYDPTSGEVHSTGSKDELEREVAAWFLDTNYDRETFLVCQAFFPAKGPDAWEKLARALRGTISEDKWEALSGLTSLAFEPGDQRRIAVKVIDHRGNEIVRVLDLPKGS